MARPGYKWVSDGAWKRGGDFVLIMPVAIFIVWWFVLYPDFTGRYKLSITVDANGWKGNFADSPDPLDNLAEQEATTKAETVRRARLNGSNSIGIFTNELSDRLASGDFKTGNW